MIIILEGPDGAGKTTLAQQLAKSLDDSASLVTSIHHGPYPNLSGQELSKVLFRSMAPALIAGSHVVMDRCWLSEPIYARAKVRPNRTSKAHQRMLERCAMAGDAVIVLCLPPYEVCHRAWSSGREEYVTKEASFKEVYNDYVALRDDPSQTDLSVLVYDYTQDNYDDLWARILAAQVNLGQGGGAFKPGEVVLLVGDKPNMKGHGAETIIVPFINFNGIGCSEWLAEQLEAAGVRESQLYWINAANARGEETDAAFIERLRPRAVVALGNAGAAWCEKHNVAHVKMPHPQHHKRFFHSSSYPAIRYLKEVLNATSAE